MRTAVWLAVPLLALFAARAVADGPTVERHELELSVDPVAGRIEGTDRLTVVRAGGGALSFGLNAGLSVLAATQDGRDVEVIRGEAEGPLVPWAVTVTPGPGDRGTVVVRYAGELARTNRPEGAGSSALTARGAQLTEKIGFYPVFDSLARRDAVVRVPAPFTAISQGSLVKTARDPEGAEISFWQDPRPSAGLSLLITRGLTVHERDVGGTQVRVLVGPEDPEYGERLLDLAATTLAQLSNRLGRYPHDRLDLVSAPGFEIETRPGFTVVPAGAPPPDHGLPPWLPRQIAQGWWGAAVVATPERAPWLDGLLDYCVAHVSVAADDPRQRAATRAGHTLARTFQGPSGPSTGRAAMVFHMLRRELGEPVFWQVLRRVARDRAGTRVSRADLMDALQKESGRNLGSFFEQWWERSGVPAFGLANAKSQSASGGFRVTGTVRQALERGEAPWTATVPIEITHLEGTEEIRVAVSAAATGFSALVPSVPLSASLDPDHHVLRRHAPSDVPACLAATLARPDVLIVHSDDDPAAAELASRLAAACSGTATTVASRDAPQTPPTRRSLVILGRAARVPLLATLQPSLALPDSADGGDDRVRVTSHRSPVDRREFVTLIDGEAELLARAAEGVLTHRTAGTAALSGDTGRWELTSAGDRRADVSLLPDLVRVPTAALPAKIVARLRAPEFEGRVAGTAGDGKARAFLLTELTLAGLEVDQQPFSFEVKALAEGGPCLIAFGEPVVGARPLVASPESLPDGTRATGVADDPGGSLQGRALVLDLPAGSADPLAFARDAATLAKARGAVALLLRLPERSTDAIDRLFAFPGAGTEGMRRSAAAAARSGSIEDLALPTIAIPAGAEPPGGPLAIHLQFVRDTVKSANVIARVRPEHERAGAPVLLGAPFDGTASDADDGAGSVAAVLEAAAMLSAQRNRLGREVVVVLFGAEAWGGRGRQAYLSGVRPDRVPTEALLTLRGSGAAAGIEVPEGPATRRLRVLLEAASTHAGLDVRGAIEGSDVLTAFTSAGIPAAALWTPAPWLGEPRSPGRSIDWHVTTIAKSLALATLALAGGH